MPSRLSSSQLRRESVAVEDPPERCRTDYQREHRLGDVVVAVDVALERRFIVVPLTARLAAVARVRNRSRRVPARTPTWFPAVVLHVVTVRLAASRRAPVAVFVMAIAVAVVAIGPVAVIFPVVMASAGGWWSEQKGGAEQTCGTREPGTKGRSTHCEAPWRPKVRPVPGILRHSA